MRARRLQPTYPEDAQGQGEGNDERLSDWQQRMSSDEFVNDGGGAPGGTERSKAKRSRVEKSGAVAWKGKRRGRRPAFKGDNGFRDFATYSRQDGSPWTGVTLVSTRVGQERRRDRPCHVAAR